MMTYNLEVVETRRFAVTLEAESQKHARELVLEGDAAGAVRFLEVVRLEVARVSEAETTRGGDNG
ncbi:hypothetical protein [Marinimicrobium sp. ABcell2]|uniref:hypothetical protein n=1 Tax=Marinimicrobium sp. ABcell2 TaxID=3069751 RepID=UPI0027B58673|nr:hypothetical protein [Marinimicrobium sp. ABcell2]MDQ2075768.1 hypothetical protein [Marinimicrobium sp. ABcell2]